MNNQSILNCTFSLSSKILSGVFLSASIAACLFFSASSFALEAKPVEGEVEFVAQIEQAKLIVNINTDDAKTLSKHLHGIGMSKANAIVQWREQNGAFSSVDQLLFIKGIGKTTLRKNEGLIALAD